MKAIHHNGHFNYNNNNNIAQGMLELYTSIKLQIGFLGLGGIFLHERLQVLFEEIGHWFLVQGMFKSSFEETFIGIAIVGAQSWINGFVVEIEAVSDSNSIRTQFLEDFFQTDL